MKPFWFVLLLLASCKPTLSAKTIRNHPTLSMTVFQPQIVDRSEPFAPSWVRIPQRSEVGSVRFVGQAFAPTVEAAKKQAQRDALAAVSSFIAVEVESEFEAHQSESNTGSSSEIHSTIRTRSGASVTGLTTDARYWEKVVASPLTPENSSYRFWVRVRVPKSEILRARLKKQSDRQKASGRKMVVVLPFSPVLDEEKTQLSNAFLDELSRRLSADSSLHVGDPSLVRSLVRRGDAEAELIERVRDTLLPDLVVAGSYQLHKEKLRVTYSLHGSSGVLKVRTLDRDYKQLFALEDDLVRAISVDVGSAAKEADAPATKTQGSLQSFELYNEAYSLYSKGDNDGAITKLHEALKLAPADPVIHMRLGRVLERLGRYGRIPSKQVSAEELRWLPEHCTPWKLISDQDRDAFLRASGGFSASGKIMRWQREGANVDHVFSALRYLDQRGKRADVPMPAQPITAVGAYYRAFAAARAGKDVVLQVEARLALADLAMRVDRLADANVHYQAVLAHGLKVRDLHLQSLAYLGLGRLALAQANPQAALVQFKQALQARAVLGEKPYMLEIFNEIGGVYVQLVRYSEAAAAYRRASRLAEELDAAYLRAVLANNIGVLDYLLGNTAAAERKFAQAWEVLEQIGEAEGAIASGLNVGYLGGYKGDVERAKAYLTKVKRIVSRTRQEGRLAGLHRHSGVLSHRSGAGLSALRDLLRSWVLHTRVGRAQDALRARNNILAADFSNLSNALIAARIPPSLRNRWVRCVAKGYADLLRQGYGFQPEFMFADPRRRRWLPASYFTNFSRSDLVYLYARLNAEAVARLTP